MTVNQIIEDGFPIARRIDSQVSSDSPAAISKSIARGISGFATAFEELAPDILLVAGDRFETYAAVVAAVPFCIPVAHCHGGETTVGAIDEALRHSITKMSHLHFVATPEYKQRVVQLGESPSKVYVSGALSIENIRKLPLMSRNALERDLGMHFRKNLLAVTFHPVTLEPTLAEKQFRELLSALGKLEDTSIVLTKPNSDTGGRVLLSMIDDFVRAHSKSSAAFASLGTERYLSLLKHANLVIGNSSSGIIEAPSLKTATVNIGDRQQDRIRAGSVVDVEPKANAILSAVQKCLRPQFQQMVKRVRNPYDHGNASTMIVRELKRVKLSGLVRKRFTNVPFSLKRLR